MNPIPRPAVTRSGHRPPTTDTLVVRFAGDSGDGIQLTGNQFASTAAVQGSGLITFPDFPAEIRAPRGTTFGVSAYQIQFGGREVRTPGDVADVLVAFNPAALSTNLSRLSPGGLVIADSGTFAGRNLAKAGYQKSPLEDGSLDGYRLLAIDITARTAQAHAEMGLSKTQSARARNFWVLGLIYWLVGHDPASTARWVRRRYSRVPEVEEANLKALSAGHAYAETAELSGDLLARLEPRHDMAPGVYRNISGTDAMALGLAAGATLCGLPLMYCSYPITPASALLHQLARMGAHGITTFQAEDEIAAAGAAIGAAYAGVLAVTASSGPGLALKTEALGLAVAAELPLVVIDVQRAGPSTGMPTKAEQSDLDMAIRGRHGEAPLAVLAPSGPADCFDIMIEAVRIATTAMTPVIVLSDAYIANASQPWRLPDVSTLEPIEPPFAREGEEFLPFARDETTLARRWARPGTPGHEHRIGGLEKSDGSGNISYDPANHQRMTELRAEKIQRIAERSAPAALESGPDSGDLLLVGWGSTYGTLKSAAARMRERDHSVSHLHLRQLWPLPRGLEAILRSFNRIRVVELNSGQLLGLLRQTFLLPAEGINQVAGQPFRVDELMARLRALLEE